jgi:glucose/arabinose dehydrogenase
LTAVVVRHSRGGCIRPYGRPSPALITALAVVLLIAGCGDDGPDEPVTTPPATEERGSTEPGSGAGGVSLRKLGDFDRPVFVAQPPGSDDLYVVEQPGRVLLVPDRDRGGETSVALDISDEVSDSGEQGLLSIAFHPQREGLLYTYFTDSEGDQRVVEFELAEDGSIDPGSRRDVLRMDDFASNHNGGLLLFGPDDLLYIGTGDGGQAADPERNGQDLGSPLGKILRIDPLPRGGRPYSIPEDNPFAGRAGARGEVFAYGLRNPWRFSFDPENGDLYVADVGQDSQEEVDRVPAAHAAGANFGWSAFEGTERFNEDEDAPGAVEPILTYGRDRGCSITGGYVVRGPELASLNGRYLYGDFCAGELRSFIPAGDSARDDRALGLTVPMLSSFATDRGGGIYATSLDGPVFQLVP